MSQREYAFDNVTGNSVSLTTWVKPEAETKFNAMNETSRSRFGTV